MPPKRHLPIEGSYNIRELGGYETRDGRRTRWKRFLRADSPHRLSEPARHELHGYGVRTIVDLRRTKEIEREPNAFEQLTEITYHHVNMIGDDIVEGPDGPGAVDLAAEYTAQLGDRRESIAQILRILAQTGDTPALYHCAVGQDRTGIISALLLSLVDVPDETIAADYTLSAEYLTKFYLSLPSADPQVQTPSDYRVRHCPAEAMLMLLANLKRIYGGAAEYLQQAGLSGHDRGRLRAKLLDP